MGDETIRVFLSTVDAALILYGVRALNMMLAEGGGPWIEDRSALQAAIRRYERQLPVDLSRLVHAKIEGTRQGRAQRRRG
jgi:hypothetical protein